MTPSRGKQGTASHDESPTNLLQAIGSRPSPWRLPNTASCPQEIPSAPNSWAVYPVPERGQPVTTNRDIDRILPRFRVGRPAGLIRALGA